MAGIVQHTWKDSAGTTQTQNFYQDASNYLFPIGCITDGSDNLVALFQAHNADNQALGATAYALNTGGVAQLLNPSGTVDRQRATGFDGSPATGIPAGSNQFAIAYSGTLGQAVTGNTVAQTVTVSSTTNMRVGDYLNVNTIGSADNETVYITAIPSGTTVTGIFKNNHSNSEPINWFHYNVARDAAIGDSQPLTGLSASMTYLWNKTLNVAEIERSAAAELDYATGNGTAVAAGYEWNGLAFDRERNLMGKGLTQATITATSGGDVNLTFSADPSLVANGALRAGALLVLSTGIPTPLTGDTVQVQATYSSGTTVPVTPVGLTSTIASGRTRASFSSFNQSGPALNGFLPDGLGIEEGVVYDPVSGNYFIERAFTQDAQSGQNVVLMGLGLWNGSSVDRAQGDANKNLKVVAAAAQGTLTDRSGTITTGGTAQQLAPVNSSRKYLFVYNPRANATSIWINFTTTAVQSQPSIEIAPGGSYVMESSYVSTELVSVIAATTSMAFVAKEG